MRIGILLLTTAGKNEMGREMVAGAGGVADGVVLTGMVSHAAAQPSGRAGMLAAQMAHITVAALWVGC